MAKITRESIKDQLSIRIPRDDKLKLEAYFAKRGLSITSGARMVLSDYMIEKGLKE